MAPFKLNTVLKHRQRLEDIARNKFIEAKEMADNVLKRRNSEKIRLLKILEEREKRQKEGIEITMLLRYEEMVTRLETNLKGIEKNLREKKKLVEQMHAGLLTHTKERQAMEQLRDEQNRAWRKEIERKEAQMLDEIAVMRHNNEHY
jgi:flagellar FliJ protein